jgi:CRISPR-associated protein Cmr2
MSTEKTLFGFTIGPIYEMMSNSQKTRELWFSSYFYSWYVKKLIAVLLKSNGNIQLHSPVAPDSMPVLKAGLFPDHIIGTSDMNEADTLNLLNSINNGIKETFVNIIKNLGIKHYIDSTKSPEEVERIFNDYLETSFIVRSEAGIEKKDIIGEMDILLDALERNRSFSLGKNNNTCFRCKLLPSTFKLHIADNEQTKEVSLCPFCYLKYRSNYCTEVLTEVGEMGPFRYRSIGEISAYELIELIGKKKFEDYISKKEEIDFEDKEFIKLIKEKDEKREVEDYHKYMAIVQADGDNLGKTASRIDNPIKLSETLFEFGIKATEITDKYRGAPIYLGGDDILSFMPTAFRAVNNITTVIDYINALSEEYIKKINELNAEGTISFGVNIFYFKSPLSMALCDARNQLNRIAKRQDGKNTLALLLTLHSGQQTGLLFKMGSTELNTFNNILKNMLAKNIDYPQGIHHNLSCYKKVITNLTNLDQLDNFRRNRFDKPVHKEHNGLDEIFNHLKEMLTDHSTSPIKPYSGEKAEVIFNRFISQLRFIKFLMGEK